MSPGRLQTRDILTIAALRSLSVNVKKLRSCAFLQHLVWCFLEEKKIEEGDFLCVQPDREKIFSVKKAEEGMAAVVSAYWIFTCQYEQKLFNTFGVIERLFLKPTLSAPRVVTTRLLNKVAKAVPS
ncbi:hypothetical protein MRX96_025715 [Rhipicephalus microplus]